MSFDISAITRLGAIRGFAACLATQKPLNIVDFCGLLHGVHHQAYILLLTSGYTRAEPRGMS